MRVQHTDSPVDDLTYDVITVLQNKAKALEAYDKYIADAEDVPELRELFEQMREQDHEHVRVLKEVLARRLEEELDFAEEDEDIEYEDYDEEDELEIEAPGETVSEAEGEDSDPPPRRGESTHRRT